MCVEGKRENQNRGHEPVAVVYQSYGAGEVERMIDDQHTRCMQRAMGAVAIAMASDSTGDSSLSLQGPCRDAAQSIDASILRLPYMCVERRG
jgi:hypothetical protein